MNYLEDDDIHFCLRCRQTILGLDAYVAHRSLRNCQPQSQISNDKSLEPVAGSSNSDSISQLIAISANPGSILKTGGVHGADGTINSDVDPSLKADDFFSLLELQSSTKSGISCPNSTIDSPKEPQQTRITEKGGGMVTRSRSKRVGGKEKEKHDSQKKVDEKEKKRKVGKKNAMKKSSDKNVEKEVVAFQKILKDDGVEVDPAIVVQDLERNEKDTEERSGMNEEEDKNIEKVFPVLFSDLPQNDTSLSFPSLASIQDDMPFSCEEIVGQDDELVYDEEEEEEEEVDAPPRSYGGKWKPGSSPSIHQQSSISLASVSWADQEASSSQMSSTGSLWMSSPSSDLRSKSSLSQKQDSMPPPGHTRGKWIPLGNEPLTLRRTGNRVQYWCGVCNRRLSSRGLYERHLMSPLHAKRTRHERQLDEDLHHTSCRPRPLTRKLQEAIASRMLVGGLRTAVKQDGTKKQRAQKTIVCEICGARVPRHQMGKHLVSRFHWRRAVNHPAAHALVAAHATAVARQAPFRCAPCRFYCNSLDELLFHWDSQMHADRDAQIAGRYWCSLCKHFDETSAGMRDHLLSEEHQELISVINKSFPIEIQKLITVRCEEPGCERIFRFNSQLRQHSRLTGHVQSSGSASDSYQDRVKCTRCSFVAHNERRMQKHMAVRHKIKNYFCSDCGLKFDSKEDAVVHRRSRAHKYKVLRRRKAPNQLIRLCPHCFLLFPDMLGLKEHLAKMHPDKAHRCAKCGESFTLKQELSRHVRSGCKGLPEHSTSYDDVTSANDVTDDATSAASGSCDSRCPMCTFTSNLKSELLYHIALHGEPISEPGSEGSKSDVLKYVCPSCPRLLRKDCLKKHLKIHTGEKLYKCPECDTAFARGDVLNKHMRVVHKSQYRCSLCDIICSNSSSLRRHLQNHEDDRQKKYHCAECGLTYYDNFALKQHMQVHSGKSQQCYFPDCVYSCRSIAELDYHLRTHSDLRLFRCDNCDYAAKTKGQLARHVKRHLGKEGNRYRCSECEYTAINHTHLKRHSRLHTGAKPYHCPHCSYTCNLQENLRKHVLSTKLHIGKYLYSCKETHCDYQSNSAKDYRVHLVQVHEKQASIAASYISGLYRYSEDFVIPGTSNSNSKPRDTLLSQSSTSTGKTSPATVLSPLLGSAVPDDPSLLTQVRVTSEPLDDIIFIQLPPSEEGHTLDGGVTYDTDASFFSASDHQLFFESLPPPPSSHSHAHSQDVEVGVEQEFVIIDESGTIQLVSDNN